MGLRDQNRDRDLGERPQRGSDTPDFQAQRRTGLHAAVPARCLQAMEIHEGTPLGAFRLRAHRLPGHHLLRRAKKRARESFGQHRPRASGNFQEIRHRTGREQGTAQSGGGCHHGLGIGQDHVFRGAFQARHHLLLHQRGHQEPSRPGQEILGFGSAFGRQLLCRAQLGRVQRRQFRLYPQRGAMPDGTFVLLPDQRQGKRAVRTDFDRGRRRGLRELYGRLHRPDAGQEPASCRRGGNRGAEGCRGQVFHRAELVSRRQGRQGRDLQLRDQTGHLQRFAGQAVLDPGGNRERDYLEIPFHHPQRRQHRGRVLLGGDYQQLPAGRYRDQGDPYRAEHQEHDCIQRGLGRCQPEFLPGSGQGDAERQWGA